MKLLRKLAAWWDPWEVYVMDFGFAYGRPPSRLRWLLSPLLMIVHDAWARSTCRLRGHKWVDEGWGGPESGCVDLICKRCGYGPGREWLY